MDAMPVSAYELRVDSLNPTLSFESLQQRRELKLPYLNPAPSWPAQPTQPQEPVVGTAIVVEAQSYYRGPIVHLPIKHVLQVPQNGDPKRNRCPLFATLAAAQYFAAQQALPYRFETLKGVPQKLFRHFGEQVHALLLKNLGFQRAPQDIETGNGAEAMAEFDKALDNPAFPLPINVGVYHGRKNSKINHRLTVNGRSYAYMSAQKRTVVYYTFVDPARQERWSSGLQAEERTQSTQATVVFYEGADGKLYTGYIPREGPDKDQVVHMTREQWQAFHLLGKEPYRIVAVRPYLQTTARPIVNGPQS